MPEPREESGSRGGGRGVCRGRERDEGTESNTKDNQLKTVIMGAVAGGGGGSVSLAAPRQSLYRGSEGGGGGGLGSNGLFWKVAPQADGRGEEGRVVGVGIWVNRLHTDIKKRRFFPHSLSLCDYPLVQCSIGGSSCVWN